MHTDHHVISLKQQVARKLVTPSVMALLIIGLFSICTFELQMRWIVNPFVNDVNQYYSYLVAEFIHHDFSFHFPHGFWLIESPIGDMIPKVTMGMAMFYFPFFVIGNNIAHIYGYDPLGYSAPFAWTVHFGTLLYVFIGFWHLRKTLLIFFSEWVSALTLILVLFATNLFYYTFREGEMAHSYLFFLFSLFLFHMVKWHFTRRFRYLCYMSLVCGFVTLIRPTEVLILILPLFYQATSFSLLAAKFRELAALRWKLLILFVLFLLPLVPQMLFWKSFANQYLFFSYGSNERFYFADPKIWSVLFGWHKGWFVYTPLAFFMVAGLVLMWRQWKQMALPITIYLLLNIYLISSWWDWGFGGAFGMRALVQTFAFLALPLAFFIRHIFSIVRPLVRVSVVSVTVLCFLFLIALNLVQVVQARSAILHWDSMTREAYSYIFLKTKYSPAEREHLQTLFKKPDYQAMRNGKRDEP